MVAGVKFVIANLNNGAVTLFQTLSRRVSPSFVTIFAKLESLRRSVARAEKAGLLIVALKRELTSQHAVAHYYSELHRY